MREIAFRKSLSKLEKQIKTEQPIPQEIKDLDQTIAEAESLIQKKV